MTPLGIRLVNRMRATIQPWRDAWVLPNALEAARRWFAKRRRHGAPGGNAGSVDAV
jgi:hypothetical protein